MGAAADRYRIRRPIQEGGMARLYLAYDERLGRNVALKLVFTDGIEPDELKAVEREARMLAQFRHPNIVAVHDSGIDTFYLPFDIGESKPLWERRPCLFIVQDLIEGKDLSRLIQELRRDPETRSKWPRRRLLKDCLLPALKGLSEAHRLGVVHRDIKPGNMMLDRSGRMYLIDFGLAQVRPSGADGFCTPMYASPEQIRGEPLDARTDVYSFGATMYHVLTFHPPFEVDDTEGLEVLQHKVLHDPPLPPNERLRRSGLADVVDPIPESLERIVLRCLAKDRKDRYASAEELANALFRFLVEEVPAGEVWLWSAGAILIREGEVGQELFYLSSGKVVIEKGGRRVAVLGPGEWFGFAALTGTQRTATVRALEPCETVIFNGLTDEKIYRTVEQDPAMAVGLTRTLAGLYLDACRKLNTRSEQA